MPGTTEIPFIEVIQEHERAWGTQSYPGRPTLAALLSAPVVLVWLSNGKDEKRQMFTVHPDLSEVNKYATRIILQSRQEIPTRRLVAIYVNQKKAVIRGVTLDIRVPE